MMSPQLIKLAKIWLVIGWFLLLSGVVGLLSYNILPLTPGEKESKMISLVIFIINSFSGAVATGASVGVLRRKKWSPRLLEFVCWFFLIVVVFYSLLWFGLIPLGIPPLKPLHAIVGGLILCAVFALVVYSIIILRSKNTE